MGELYIAVVTPLESDAVKCLPKLPGVTTITGNDVDTFRNFASFKEISAIVWISPGNVKCLEELVTSCPITWLHSFSAGVDHIGPFIKQYLQGTDIVLTNGRGAFSNSLAEYVMAGALYFNKQWARSQENKRLKKWDKFVMPQLDGKTMGFVGFGHIAKVTAKIAKHGFNMKVIALRRNPNKDDHDGLVETTFGYENKLELFKQSDFVVCVLPGTPETQDFVSKAEFAAMKSDSVFISIGRGAAVDEAALLDALNTGSIAGAALDVFKQEPMPPENPLWEAPNLHITAHNADLTHDYFELGWEIWRKNLDAFKSGKHARDGGAAMYTPVDKAAGY